MSELSDNIWEFIEELVKSRCVRCSNEVSGGSKGSRCSECRKKLNAARQTAGHPERAQNKAQQAIRREKHGNGTATPKAKGKAESNKELAAKMQRAEKKAGQKLSPDRKDNNEGYNGKNTRAIPEHLNRGRHNADEKKIKEWKKKLKKNNITEDEFAALLFAKAESYGIDVEHLMKGAPAITYKPSSLADHVGVQHELELHPDIDNLYRVKNAVLNSGASTVKKANLQKQGFNPNLLAPIPHDGKGNISVKNIEDHIESLPKTKVIASVEPYKLGMQQHRPGEQHAITVKLHPDEMTKFDNKTHSLISAISPHQHRLHDNHGVLDQIGWSRIDDSAPGHWHIDEIQSDMQNHDKIKKIASIAAKDIDLNDQDVENVHAAISGNHDDPQHLVHSAVNALGRKLNVNSTSMDMPDDQAKQSSLQTNDGTPLWPDDHQEAHFTDEDVHRWGEAVNNHFANRLSKESWENDAQNHPNQYLRSALKKLNRDEIVEGIDPMGSEPVEDFEEGIDEEYPRWENTREIWGKLSDPEKDSFREHLRDILYHSAPEHPMFADRDEELDRDSPRYQELLNMPPPPGFMHVDQERFPYEEPQEEKPKLPVHQIDTYDKRPKKLGMKPVDKASILGENPKDRAKQVQYSELYKKIQEILEQLR